MIQIKINNEEVVGVSHESFKREGWIEIESIPDPENREGYFPVMYYRNGKVEYEYLPVPEEPEGPEMPIDTKSETQEKVKAMFFASAIPTMINGFGLSDDESLDVMEYYPAWENDIDVVQGEKYRDGDKLYEVDQSHHTQENWRPSIMSSLWHEVVKNHKGTKEDPIPYNEELNPFWQGMILEEGKYYTQSGKVYKCVRSSGIKMTHNLADLVSGGFVQEV